MWLRNKIMDNLNSLAGKPAMQILCLGLTPFFLVACLGGFFNTEAVNNPPKFLIEKYGPDTVRTGDPVKFTLPILDDDNDAITLTVLDTSFSIVQDTINWRPAVGDTGWKTVVVYADDQKGGVDSISVSFFVVFSNHYHLVAALYDGLVMHYASILSWCSVRCEFGGFFWEAAYSKDNWDNGDTPSNNSRAFGYYDNGHDAFPEDRPKGCEIKIRIDSLKISADSAFIRMHKEDPCPPFKKTDDYYMSGLGLFYSQYSDSRLNTGQTNYFVKGETSPRLFHYVSTIDSLLKIAHK